MPVLSITKAEEKFEGDDWGHGFVFGIGFEKKLGASKARYATVNTGVKQNIIIITRDKSSGGAIAILPVVLKVQSTADMKLLRAMLRTSINSLTLVMLTYLSFINSLTTHAFSMKHGCWRPEIIRNKFMSLSTDSAFKKV